MGVLFPNIFGSDNTTPPGFLPPPPPTPGATTPPPSVLGSSPDSVSQSNYIAAQLRQANSDLITLEQSLIQANNSGNKNYVTQMGPSIQNARGRYETILKSYIYAYGLAFGNPPDTTGLAQWQVYLGAGAALGVILIAAYELNNYLANVKLQAQTQLASAQNSAYAMQQASAAQAAGDTATAQQWLQTAQSASAAAAPPSSTLSWFKSNWFWLAAAAAGIVILPDLI